MDWWVALVPVLLSIGLVYFALCQVLVYLFRKHLVWFFVLIIVIAPFGFVLAQVSSWLELVWMLLLTPFYGIFVLLLTATTWMVRFYCSSFAVLMITQFILNRRALAHSCGRWGQTFEPFWRSNPDNTKVSYSKIKEAKDALRRTQNAFSNGVAKYWTLAAAALLVMAVAGTMVNGSQLRDPTYYEATRFIFSDKTDGHPYVAGNYTCANFATDFQSNAAKAGLRCGYVTIFFKDMISHALDCFNTTDNGIVYVEPQSDEIVSVKVGEVYAGSAWNLQVKNATIVGFFIKWQLSGN